MFTNKVRQAAKADNVRLGVEAFMFITEWVKLGGLTPDAMKQLALKVKGDADRFGYNVQGSRPDVPFTETDATRLIEAAAIHVLQKIDPKKYAELK